MHPFPQHAALELLLEQEQFHACRLVAERMIEELMAPSTLDHAAETFSRWQYRDLELARLHNTLSRCLLGLHNYEEAATAADAAALLARKTHDLSLYAEAVHIAGVCRSQAGNYRAAVESFSKCMDHATGVLYAKAVYNRGHAYERMCAYRYAAADYEAGAEAATDLDKDLRQVCRANLAWMLVLLKEFARAEDVMMALQVEADAAGDQQLQLQISHDRFHLAYLQGEGRRALQGALLALKACTGQFPQVRAQMALTLVGLAADTELPEQAFTVGLLAKRLAGRARRPDLDEAASRGLQALEIGAGTDCLAQALQRLQQVAPLGKNRRRMIMVDPRAGGVG